MFINVNKTLLSPYTCLCKSITYAWTWGKLTDSQNTLILLPFNYFLLGPNFSSFNFTTIFTATCLSDVPSFEISGGLIFPMAISLIVPSFFFQSEVFLWPRIWSILVNVPCAPEKHVFCCYWMEWQLDLVGSWVLFSSSMSLLIFCKLILLLKEEC